MALTKNDLEKIREIVYQEVTKALMNLPPLPPSEPYVIPKIDPFKTYRNPDIEPPWKVTC